MEQSKFFDYLRAGNAAELAGLTRWVFQPGMEFKAMGTWWGVQKPRVSAHEGIDLCYFADAAGQVRQLAPQLRIPATFAGEVIRLEPDFLGQSIYLAHEIYAADGRRLVTAYGHTRPLAGLKVGKQVAAGEPIATLAAPGRSRTVVLPHLHLTLAWIPRTLAPERLAWQNLGHDPDITLIDPLAVCPMR